MSPRLSIGMPVYNGERYVEEALEALLRQTFVDYDLIVVDNGSTDRTPTICRSFAAKDERIHVERSDVNRGAAWSFNRVFQLSVGQYFKWAAYDDVCAPRFLERCIVALDTAPSAVLAYPKTRLIDDDGQGIRDHDDGLDLRSPHPHERLRQLLRALGYANPVYGVIRASALRQTRLLGSYASSDYVLLAELALQGDFLELPERLFLRRIHTAMSRQANPTAAEAAVWFQPKRARRPSAEAWRLCFEHVVSIVRAPLSLRDKLRCSLTFALVGGRRYSGHLVHELRQIIVAPLHAR